MARFFRRNARFIAAVGVVIVLVALMNVTSRERDHLTYFEQRAAEVMAPVERWGYGLATGVRSWILGLGELRSTRAENRRLKTDLGNYEVLQTRLYELAVENERLRALLEFKAASPMKTVAARVIARNPDSWFSQVVIDKGRSSGLDKDMPVMTPGGLVGKLVKVTDTTSTVLLLLDPESGVGGLVQRTRDAGVLLGAAGAAGKLQIKFFSRDARVEVGDDIISSGLGGVFPSGLPLGRVTRVEQGEFGLVKFADVKPNADFSHLDEVLVIQDAGVVGPVPGSQP
ncbi:MAG TPA: rod shape-determining protein MreC [Bacillota bacterium]